MGSRSAGVVALFSYCSWFCRVRLDFGPKMNECPHRCCGYILHDGSGDCTLHSSRRYSQRFGWRGSEFNGRRSYRGRKAQRLRDDTGDASRSDWRRNGCILGKVIALANRCRDHGEERWCGPVLAGSRICAAACVRSISGRSCKNRGRILLVFVADHAEGLERSSGDIVLLA